MLISRQKKNYEMKIKACTDKDKLQLLDPNLFSNDIKYQLTNDQKTKIDICVTEL